jgi:multisubunit Na+/H+ antiporter MnhC subunit
MDILGLFLYTGVFGIFKQCVCWVCISTNFLQSSIEVFLFFSGLIGFGYFPNLNQNSKKYCRNHRVYYFCLIVYNM